jgi:hypothetical protein
VPLAAAFVAYLAANLVPLAIRLLVGVGLGAATYTGVNAAIEYAKGQVIDLVAGAGTVVVQWVAFFYLDRVITLVFSALVVRWVLRGLDKVTDAMRTTSWKPPVAAP